MQLETTVKTKVQEYVSQDEMFTTVDIANAIKRDGIWIRNREVRDWLHLNFTDQILFGNYTMSTIDVCNGNAQASLYHPTNKNPDSYTARDQVALTPEEVKDIQKTLVGTPNPSAAPDINTILDNSSTPELSRVIKSKERIKIPGDIIRKLGLTPGDRVDPALIKTHTVLTGDLYVNSDCRVSIPRSSVGWGTDPVKVMFQGGAVIFDKA